MIEHLKQARRHRDRAAADPRPSSTTAIWSRRSLKNYWGYNTLAFFAPEARYAQDNALDAFRTTVARAARRRHRGHPRRGLQPHLPKAIIWARRCRYRGIDNASYYWLTPDNPRYYDDFTGCGNSLEPHASARAADGDGFAALLGRGLSCRRLPLRSCHHAGARPNGLRSQRAVL